MRRKIAAGNWKMNGTGASLDELRDLAEANPESKSEILICPPATLIDRAAALAPSTIAIGAQDCHAAEKGAHTGDLSATMLADAGATHIIVGHSERRADHEESDKAVKDKAEAVLGAGLVAVLCLGEDLGQREAGKTLEVVGSQLAGSLPQGATGDNLIIAYEPVWAIGTGLTPTTEQIADVHAFLRKELAGHLGAEAADAVRLLYGGSVKPSNAAEIFAVANVDGALVGGASLKASDFGPIVAALNES